MSISFKTIVKGNMTEFFAPFEISETFDKTFEIVSKETSEEIQEMEENQCANSKNSNSASFQIFGNTTIMKVILERLELFDIQRLRKVSSIIRSCIDYIKPDPKIKKYSLKWGDYVADYGILIELDSGISDTIYYDKSDDKWLVNHKHVLKEDSAPFVKDFEINLRHVKTVLPEFLVKLRREDYLEEIGHVLRTRPSILRVKYLKMSIEEEMDVLEVLPYVDSRIIETIRIVSNRSVDSKRENMELNLSNVVRLDQWTNAKNLIMKHFLIENPIGELNLTSFENVNIKAVTITTEEVMHIKQELLQSSTFGKIRISLIDSSIDESLYTSMSPYRRIEGVRSVWYYRMPNYPDHFLHILYQDGQLIVFNCVDKKDVPDDVL